MDCLGEPVPEEPLPIHASEEEEGFAQTARSALSQQGC